MQLVARNFQTRRGEIDLIMLDRQILAFIEVRFRAAAGIVGATLSVDNRKQKKIIQTAALFLSMHPRFRNHVCRFDIVGVDRDCRGQVSIQWLRDAFRSDV
jgi:putative endonuclease